MCDDSMYVSCLNVIIVHWQDSASLRSCLNAAMKSDYPKVRFIIVENGSRMEERTAVSLLVEEAALQGADIHLLQQAANLGYAGGNNAGVRYLNSKKLDGPICIVNPDVMLESKTLKHMNDQLVGDVGIVMCRALSSEGKILYDAIRLRGYRQKRIISEALLTESDYAQGACMLIHRDLASSGELFDEQFFLYWEEVDLSIRARQAGFRVVSTARAQVVRKNNSLSRLPNAMYYSIRNGWLLLKKHPELFSFGGFCLYSASLLPLTLKFYADPRMFLHAWRSLLDGLTDAIGGRYGQKPTQGSSHLSG